MSGADTQQGYGANPYSPMGMGSMPFDPRTTINYQPMPWGDMLGAGPTSSQIMAQIYGQTPADQRWINFPEFQGSAVQPPVQPEQPVPPNETDKKVDFGPNPFRDPLQPAPDVKMPTMPGSDMNIYQMGSQGLTNAFDAFGRMGLLGQLPSLMGSEGYRRLAGLGNITDGSNLQDGAGYDIIKNLQDVTRGNEMESGRGYGILERLRDVTRGNEMRRGPGYGIIEALGNVTRGDDMQRGEGAGVIRGANPILDRARQAVSETGNTSDFIDDYMNPYTDKVIDRSIQDMRRTNDIMQDQNNASAAAAGAFGGDRHGLTGATIASDLVRNQGDMAAQLRNQGFNTAANLAAGHVGQNMARANALTGIDQAGFNNQLAQGGALAGLQGQDIANQFRDYANQFQRGQTMMGAQQADIANQYRNYANRFQRGQSMMDAQSQDIANRYRNYANEFQRGQSMMGAQERDIANQFKDWQNRFAQGQTMMGAQQSDIANLMSRNAQNNQTLMGQGNAFSNLANQMFRIGDQSVDRQAEAGSQAQQMNQRLMDAAAQIYDQNGPMAAIMALQAALGGNPLMGELIQRGTRDPGSLETIGTILGGGGDLLGK